MDDITTIIGYHGTDIEIAKKILISKFTYKVNKTHWLGNGIYFYMDFCLAEWWTKNPTTNYGINVRNPAIIEVILACGTKYICDMRKLSTYNFLRQEFSTFLEFFYANSKPKKPIEMSVMRCSFFDWLVDNFKINMVIGTFCKYESSYLKDNSDIFKEMTLPYIEVQACVFNDSIICIKEIKE